MSSPTGKRDIVRLRTFADDVERAKSEKGVSDQVVAAVLPKEAADTPKKGVFHTVKKKSVALKDESQKGTQLDTDGITFDADLAGSVSDQAYEEHQAIKEETKAAAPEVEIRQTDALDRITEAPKTTPPPVEPTRVAPPVAPVTLKQEETIDQIKATEADIDTTPEISKDDVSAGEIVTDKKRERFKLFPAMGQALSDWVVDTKDQIEEAQKEKYTVSKIEDRVETIKAAAQKKTLVPEEDYAEVAKRLKEVKKVTQENTPVIVKPKTEVVASWTHTTSDDQTETESDTSTTPEPAAVAPAAPTPPVTAEPDPVVTSQPVAEQPVTNTIQNANISVEDLAKIAGGMANSTPQTTPQAVAPTTPAPKPAAPKLSLPKIGGTREFLPSPILAMAVVVIAIISGIGTSFYFLWQPEEQVELPKATTVPLFTAQLQTDLNFTESHSEIMSTLLSAINTNPGSLYIYFTRNLGQDVVPPTEIMSFLAPQAPGSFTRSVTNISFGAYDNQPFIVMRVNNFDNAFSGMLSWEQTMSTDLAPLFGPVVLESFDPQARTSSQTRSAFFRDVVASNLSGRLLADENGDDRIIYTFVDKQTIVITTDRLQLTNVLPLIR